MRSASSQRPPSQARGAFTLVELLVVIAIIGVLIALLLPAVQAAREAARRSQCSNNLKQLGLAFHNYHDTRKTFPAGGHAFGAELAWSVYVLPYMEENTLYEQFNMNATDYPQNHRAATTRVGAYLCPSGTVTESQHSSEVHNGMKTFTMHYYGIMGPFGDHPQAGTYRTDANPSGHGGWGLTGILGLKEKTGETSFASITDGSSKTFLLGELSWDDANVYRAWHRGGYSTSATEPMPAMSSAKNVKNAINAIPFGSSNFNDVSFGSNHPQIAQFLMADGSVRTVNENVDMLAYKASSSRNGGESQGVE